MTNDMNMILKFKRQTSKGDLWNKKQIQPKTCQACGLLLLQSTISQYCSGCKHYVEKGSAEEFLRPKHRPFDSNSTCNKSSKSTLDDFLKTGKFVEYIQTLNRYLPDYLLSANVIKSSKDELYYSALGCMNYSELSRHLVALRIEHIQRWCRPVLQRMMQNPKNMNIFNVPVDVVALDIPHYYDKIKRPMDFGTIRSQLQQGKYESVSSCLSDMQLVFENAMIFNPSENFIHQMAKALSSELETEIKSLDEKCFREMERKLAHSCTLCLGSSCPLCGEKCLKFEPQVLVCHGPCSQRIKKNSVYFVTPDASSVWCQKCFAAQPGSSVWSDPHAPPYRTQSSTTMSSNITMAPVLTRRNVLKRRTDEEVAEPWVSCDSCGHWVHQICALYCDQFYDHGESNPGYQCPLCRLEFAASAAVLCEAKFRDQNIKRSVEMKCSTISRSTRHGGSNTNITASRLKSEDTMSQSSRNREEVGEISVSCSSAMSLSSRGSLSSFVSCKDTDSLGYDNYKFTKDTKSIQELVSGFQGSQEDGLISDSDVQNDYTSETETDLHSHGCSTDGETVTVNTYKEVSDSSIDVRSSKNNNINSAIPLSHSNVPISLGDEVTLNSDHDSLETDIPPNSDSETVVFSSIRKRKCINSSTEILVSPPATACFPCEESRNVNISSQVPEYPQINDIADDGAEYNRNLKQWRAKDLPRTRLSDFIESLVKERLRTTGHSDAANSVTVRLTSNCENQLDVPEPIMLNMMNQDGTFLPRSLPYKQKCILLFQQIDGVDVCLFCLYVQEFDKNTPPPNNSVVYIAYIDSVDYFRPLEARTMVYHEILVGYLKWVQMRGFKQGHIWACPPQRGDNFIFWCHPPHQRTPSRDRLNAWYSSVLQRCSRINILDKVTNLWNEYFSEYGKKEDHMQRQAARNSFVGQGNVKSACQSKTNLVTSVKSISNPNIDNNNNQITVSTVTLNGEPVPVCPPIFEGEYWVSSCLRIHSQMMSKNQGCDGKDTNVNIRRCRDIIKHLMAKHLAIPFNQPVDPVALVIPDYPRVITKPMDLGTVRDKLRAYAYPTVLHMVQDVRLTFDNALLFNPAGHPVHNSAKILKAEFEHSMVELIRESVGANSDSSVLQDKDTEELDKWLISLPLVESNKDQALSDFSLIQSHVRGKSFDIRSLTSHMTSQNMSAFEGYDTISNTISNHHSLLERQISELTTQFNEDIDDYHMGTYDRIDMTGSTCETVNDDMVDYVPFRARIRQRSDSMDVVQPPVTFEQPQLGFRGAIGMMGDLSKAVMRLKEDLFVFKFADPSSVSCSNGKKRRSTSFGDNQCDDSISISQEESETIDNSEYDMIKEIPVSNCTTEPAPIVHNESMNTSQNSRITNSVPGRRGRKKGSSNKSSGYCRGPKIRECSQEDEGIPEFCLHLMENIHPDTSDPDSTIDSPFVDSRHTFLEMCQYRHFQFDTLRRAKHSSLLLLYHLHNSSNRKLRPQCASCHEPIRDLRWHCDMCTSFDMCDNCHCSSLPSHEHLLTPFRVSYI